MSRPPLPVGAHGEIGYVTTPAGTVQARAYVRLPNGARRRMVRTGKSKAQARRRLVAALAEGPQAGGVLNGDTTIEALSRAWWAEFTELDRAPRTVQRYAEVLRAYVVPRLGALRLGEATTGRLSAELRALARDHGTGNAKQAQTVLRNMFKHAVNHDALPHSPMLEVQPITAQKRTPDALTVEQVREVLGTLPAGDVRDVFEVLLATGARIGEVLGIRWEDLDLEGEHPSVRFAGKVSGPQWEPFTKSHRENPPMLLPTFGADVFRRREQHGALVFPNAVGNPWDPNGFRRKWREVMAAAGYPDLNTHKIRRTVATQIAAVMDSQTAAEQLHHSSTSITERYYIARLQETVDATRALEAFRK